MNDHPDWRQRGIRTLREALECVVEGNGEIFSHHSTRLFVELQKRGYVTYEPGRGMNNKKLDHGHWTATPAGIAKNSEKPANAQS